MFIGSAPRKFCLNSDRVRRKSAEVDLVHVEVGDVDDLVKTCYKTVSRTGFRTSSCVIGQEDGKESLLEGDEGEPEHGADEEVDEVLNLGKRLA